MAKQIKHSDIAEKGLMNPTIENLKELDRVLGTVIVSVKSLSKDLKKTFKGADFKTPEGVKKFKAGLSQLGEAEKQYQNTLKQRKVILAKMVTQQTEAGKANTKLKIHAQEQAKASKALARDEMGLTSVYQKQSKKLNDLRNKYKEMALTQGTSGKAARKLRKEITKLDTKLKKIDASVGQFQRSVGNYGKAFRGLGRILGAAGLTLGLMGLFRVLGNGMKIIRDFDQAQADLASILNVSRKEMKALTKDAKRLGSQTIFTATQVSKLQKEYAKLGFSQRQILKLTKATLNLAAATGTDLARAAEVVGNTLRAFRLEASEADRVVNVMALSFTKSSLDMERFSTAMATVAPVAANAGVSLERTTALLGTLVSAGIDASSAGTGLRNIFLELAKSGMSFNQAMDEINNSSDKNAAALQLFGKRGAAVGSVLANSTKEVTKFEKALLSAGNVAEEMANKQLNTIAGKTKLMTSAWEGFILALEDGEGPLAAVIGGAIDLVSDLLVGLTNLLKTNRQIREEAQEAAQSITDSVANDQIDVIKILTKKGTEELKGFLKTLEETGRSVTGKASNFFETVLIHNIIRAREAGISEGEIMVKESFKLFSEFGKDAEKQLKILQGVRDKAEEGGDEFAESIFSDKEFIEFEAKVEQAVAFSQAGLDAVRSGIKDATEQDLQSIVDSTKGKLQTLAQFELDARALALNTLEGGSASGSAKRSKKELTRLQELKKELKEVEKIREKALTTPEAQRTQEFQFNTRKRDDLTKEIAQLERILALKNEAIAVRSGEIKVEDEERGPELSAENKAFENEENIAEDRRELITQQINDIQSVTEVLADEAQRRLEIQQDLLDSEAALARRRIDQLSRIAKAGQLEAGQSIAVEEKRLAELERKKLKAKQREQRIEAAVAGFKLLGDAIDKDSTRPVAETVSGILKITAALQAIPQFFDGTEDTGKGGEGVDGKGGFRAVLHPHERVVDRKNNEAMQGLSNSELAEAAKLYNTGVQSDSYKAGQMPMQLVEHAYMSNAQILKKFDKLSETMQDGNDLIANAIINKEVPYLKYDETLNAVIEGVKQGNKNTGIHIDLNY